MKTQNEIKVLRGHTAEVISVAFSPDGETIASGSADRTIRLWDVETGESKTTLHGHGYRVWSVMFSPDGRKLASGSHELRVWRAWRAATVTPNADDQATSE